MLDRIDAFLWNRIVKPLVEMLLDYWSSTCGRPDIARSPFWDE